MLFSAFAGLIDSTLSLKHSASSLQFCTVSSIFFLIFVFSVLTWIVWYIWTFTISPQFFPYDAPLYPYVIPGHAYDYFQGSHQLIAKARHYFGNTTEPFAIVLAGVRHYVITAPGDAHIMYSRPLIFNFDYFLSKALSGFGVAPSRLDDFWRERGRCESNPSGKCLVHVTEDIYKRNLLPGSNLSSLINSHKMSLGFYLSFEQLACRCGLTTEVQTDPVSLYKLCTTVMTDSMQACLFDPILLAIDPEMTTDMEDFTDDLWMLMHPSPMVNSTRVNMTLKRYHSAMKKYQKLPDRMRTKEAGLMKDLIYQYHDYRIHEDDSAAVLVMVYWAAVSNIAKLPYWILVHVLFDEQLCASIRAEISPAMNEQDVNSNYLLRQCPLLESVYLETLRLVKMDHSYRKLERDTEVGGKMLRKGSIAIVSTTELHRDQTVFGSAPSEFDATRFLKQPKISSSKSYKPYGSGSTYCPGREFALQETLVFVALMLHRFDLQIDRKAKKPQLDQELLTVGLSRPVPGTDIQVSLQQQSNLLG